MLADGGMESGAKDNDSQIIVFFTVVLTSEEAEPRVEDGEASKPVRDLQSRDTFNAG
jgi:hypothetical protein